MRLPNAALFLVLSVICSQSFAQEAQVPRVLTNTDSLIITGAMRILALDAAARPPLQFEVSLGAGYIRGQNESKTITSPFEALAIITQTETRLKIFGRGYQRTELGAFKVNGLADVTLQVLQPVMKVERGVQVHVVAASVAASVPTATDVSAKHSTPSVALYYIGRMTPEWEVWGVVNGSQTNVPLPPTISDRAYTGVIRVAHYLNPSPTSYDQVRIQVQSTRRSGVRTNSVVATAYEARVSDCLGVTADLGVTAELTRGLTQGSRDTAIDLSLRWRF